MEQTSIFNETEMSKTTKDRWESSISSGIPVLPLVTWDKVRVGKPTKEKFLSTSTSVK